MKPLAAAILAACGGLGLAATGASAQDAVGERNARRLETTEVEGQAPARPASPKFTAPLVDTPQTIAVIPETVYAAQGARTLNDVLRNTPGITYNGGENGFAAGNGNFSLRGFDVSDSIFIDGVRDSGSIVRDIFNVEQVEVAKGPAGDNGRGTAGGYVNLVTKTPKLADSYSGSVSYGNDWDESIERYRASADLNAVVGETSAIRLNLVKQDGGVAGRDYAEQNSWGVAPSFAIGLGTDFRFTLASQHVRTDDVPDFGVPAAFISGMDPYGQPGHEALAGDPAHGNFYGLVSDFDDTETDAVLARFEYDFRPGMTLSNQTRWSNNDREAIYTVATGLSNDAQTVTVGRMPFQRENTTLSNLTNLSSQFVTGNIEHHISAGLDVSREEAETGRVFPSLGTTTGTNLYDPDPFRGVSGAVELTPTYIDKAEIESIGLYVYDTLEFGERWQLTGGLRVEQSDVKIRTRARAGGDVPENQDARYDRDDTTVSGKIGLVYKPTENGSVYGSFGVSVLPPGSFLSNPDGSRGDMASSFPNILGQNNPESDEQKFHNYEIGSKWNFLGDRLTASAALFRTIRKNIAMGPDGEGGFAGYGEQVAQGLELGVSGAITERWTVFGGVLFLDTERRHGAAIDEALIGGDYEYDDGTLATDSTDGEELSFAPDFSANLWTTYSFGNGFTIGGGLVHAGDSWVGRPDNVDRVVANGTRGELPGYTVLNLLAAYRWNENLQLRLNLDNVTDELYATKANWSARRVDLGAPRSYLLSLDWRF